MPEAPSTPRIPFLAGTNCRRIVTIALAGLCCGTATLSGVVIGAMPEGDRMLAFAIGGFVTLASMAAMIGAATCEAEAMIRAAASAAVEDLGKDPWVATDDTLKL